MESDPFRFFPDRERLTRALEKLDLLVALDYLPTKIAAMATVFLPTAPLFETESTFVNQEGRVQFAEPFYRSGSPIGQVSGGGHPPRVFQKEIPGGEIKPAWMILAELGNALAGPGQDSIKVSLKEHWEWMIQNHPALSGVTPFAAQDGIRLTMEKDDQTYYSDLAGEGRKLSGRDGLEILCVDWTFGTEELSSFSPFIQRAENPPCLYIRRRTFRVGSGKDNYLSGRRVLEIELRLLKIYRDF
jgi:NADH-quinone oxidoreductase subunit G